MSSSRNNIANTFEITVENHHNRELLQREKGVQNCFHWVFSIFPYKESKYILFIHLYIDISQDELPVEHKYFPKQRFHTWAVFTTFKPFFSSQRIKVTSWSSAPFERTSECLDGVIKLFPCHWCVFSDAGNRRRMWSLQDISSLFSALNCTPWKGIRIQFSWMLCDTFCEGYLRLEKVQGIGAGGWMCVCGCPRELLINLR